MEPARGDNRHSVVLEGVERAQRPCPRCDGKLIAVFTRERHRPYFLKCTACDFADG